jgi:hypothetical protein
LEAGRGNQTISPIEENIHEWQFRT